MDIKLSTIQRLSLQIVGLTYQKYKTKDPEFLAGIDKMTTEINKLCDSAALEVQKKNLQTRALNSKVESLRRALQRSGSTPVSSPAKRPLVSCDSEGEPSPGPKSSSRQLNVSLAEVSPSNKEKVEMKNLFEKHLEMNMDSSCETAHIKSEDDTANTTADDLTEEEKKMFEEELGE